MQINTNNIQRPTLITPFFDRELYPDNSFVEYIKTTSNKNFATSLSNNIKKALKNINVNKSKEVTL